MTVAQDVRNHLRNKPYLLEALEKGIVNLSELSRQLQKELKLSDISAIKAALRRYAEELQKHRQKREEKVLHLLKKSSIAVYDRKSVMITAKELDQKGMKVDLLDKFVYLMDRSDMPERITSLIKHENCTMIVVHSPEELENTPGVVAFLATLLSEQNVNIVEFISCWTETIMVVEKKDSLKAYEVLSNLVG
jgi:aspartokinase